MHTVGVFMMKKKFINKKINQGNLIYTYLEFDFPLASPCPLHFKRLFILLNSLRILYILISFRRLKIFIIRKKRIQNNT